jgi:predicted nuclease of predicted toxin-antitoxin system
MKLLFDQNLSHKLCAQLHELFPDSAAVQKIGLDDANDIAIWQHAHENDFLLATQDSDFADLAALRGIPPKIIWLRCGNQPTKTIENLLRIHARDIRIFWDDPNSVVLEIY